MRKIAVVGERDSIYGFAALGLEVFPVKGSKEARAVVMRLINEDLAVIFLTESIVAEVYDELLEFTAEMQVSIIPIPGVAGEARLGMKALKKSVIKAVGTDILFS